MPLYTSEDPPSVIPPSLKFSSSTVKVSVKYVIRAVVERHKFYRRNMTAYQELELRPLQPPSLQPLSLYPETEDHANYIKLVEYPSSPFLETSIPEREDCGSSPPAYSPSLALEVCVPRSRIIVSGKTLDFGITIYVPAGFQHSMRPFWLKSLSVHILATTTASVAYNVRSHTSHISTCYFEGWLPLERQLDGERVTLPSELWSSHIYPLIQPSFSTQNVRRTHKIKFKVELLGSQSNKTLVGGSSLNLWLQTDMLSLGLNSRRRGNGEKRTGSRFRRSSIV